MSTETTFGDRPRGYSFLARLIHWVMAFIMITMIIAGIWMATGDLWGGKFPPLRGQLYDYHRGMGFVLLILVIMRLIIKRFSIPPSPLPSSIPARQQKVAHLVHTLLYASLIIHPLLGWYATNAWGVKNIPIFGLLNLPTLVDKDRELGNFLLEIHGYIGFVITALILTHICAAMMHQFIKKDGVLLRMMRT
ncbi:MAG: cytochrome b [Hyphomicrobiales bacterium]